jgi:GTP-sensing pleiotropic transcriptional regulator CodY
MHPAIQQSFQQLEKELHETYQQIAETQTGLPESVKEIISRQQQALGLNRNTPVCLFS